MLSYCAALRTAPTGAHREAADVFWRMSVTMPILPAEPTCFPSQLFDEALTAPVATDRAWWVLHTKPRQEKSLARQLCDAEVPFYLPLIARRLRIRGRTLTSHVPLFAGYVFL